MGTTLQHGIFLPAEGERNCYAGLASNWTILDGVVGGYSSHAANLTIHVTAADKEAWNGKADTSALTAHTGDTTIHVTAEDKNKWDAVTGKADSSALTAHTGNTTIHVTAADKEAWNGKQDALSQTQLDAVNSGIDSSKVQQIATNTSDISSLQSGKANDNSVVHTSGNETVGGIKAFDSNTFIYNSDNTATTPNLYLKSSKIEISSQGNTSGDQNLTYLDKNGTAYTYIKGAVQSNGSAVKIRTIAKDSSANSVVNEIQILAGTNGNKAIFPLYSNEVDLGVSGYKWKSFNGLTPSSLGMPSNTFVDISGYVTDLSGGSNLYTAPDNGIVAVDISGTNMYVLYNNTLSMGERLTGSNFRRAGIIQVRKNDAVIIQSDGGTLNYAKFYPCQGNI